MFQRRDVGLRKQVRSDERNGYIVAQDVVVKCVGAVGSDGNGMSVKMAGVPVEVAWHRVEAIQHVPEECIHDRCFEQGDTVPVPQNMEDTVATIQLVPWWSDWPLQKGSISRKRERI